jgi:hypothetical protein
MPAINQSLSASVMLPLLFSLVARQVQLNFVFSLVNKLQESGKVQHLSAKA